MATKNNNECSSQALGQGDNATWSTPNEINANQIKSGSLFLSSKGIGWFSWKKRWFILTRTSLVFYRSDPNAAPHKGGEMNLTLGGIDLNSSASVEVKPDKKLITMFFPDGRDGRAFTLKAETMEDLYEWKSAIESALAQAPSATHSTGQNGVFNNEQTGLANGPGDQQNDKSAVESIIIGRPILLVLEDIDGSPSFLEKALTFIETYGIKVEGILRQAADVEEVHRRVREYEQGKTEFSPNEDAHIIADCIKYILRELPSSPVPASCCTALLQAFKSGRANKANNMRTAILETFPEPNRKLLQRILIMCKKIASHKAENLMSVSAVAACMSPLLLRPLLSGECELENTHMDVAGDGSLQLLQAAAAANHAQAIIITLLEEYDHIFGESTVAPEMLSNSEECGSDEEYDDDDDDDEEYDEDEEEYDDEDEDEDEDDDVESEYEHSISGANSDDDRAERSSFVESDDLLREEEEEIKRLTAIKMELQNRIAEEADANAKLKDKLEKRKKALHEHRLALEKDVAGLREQLQKEKDIRADLEAEMNMPQLPGSSSSNDKMKVNIEGIAVAEEKFNNLKQRLDDLGEELNHQIHQNITLMQDKVMNMENATREASSRIERSSESENQSHLSDPLKGSFMEVPDSKNSFSPSKNSIRVEGDNPTSSPLTKLTTRLNALKERRNQIASDQLHNIDKTQGPSGPTTQNPNATSHKVDKSQGQEGSNRNQGITNKSL